jgi:hypothetical protein
MNARAIVRRSGKILIAFVILWMAYAIGYHNGLTSAGKRVFVGVERGDTKVTEAETIYKPYFAKKNFTKVIFTITNPIPAKVQ